MDKNKKPLTWFDRILIKRVSFLWLIAALLFWCFASVAIVCILIMGSGFYNYQEYLDQSRVNCAEYCDSLGQTLYLHDFETQACQCYNENEDPTDYKNLRSGVEIKYTGG